MSIELLSDALVVIRDLRAENDRLQAELDRDETIDDDYEQRTGRSKRYPIRGAIAYTLHYVNDLRKENKRLRAERDVMDSMHAAHIKRLQAQLADSISNETLIVAEQDRNEARRIARWLRQSYDGPAYDLLTDEEQGWLDTMDQWS